MQRKAILRKKRIYLKAKEYWKFKDKLLEIALKKNNKSVSYIRPINKERRFSVPKNIREKLNLKSNDTITIKIKEIKTEKRKKEIVKNNKLNSLALIPEKTLSGYPISIVDKKDKFLCWYFTYGGSRKIYINKTLPIKFVKCLGYFQAEGGKGKLIKRRGREFSFVNTSPIIIKDFIELLEFLIDLSILKATIYHHKNLSKNKIEEIKNKLVQYGLKKENIKVNRAKIIKKYSIRLWISSSILTDIFNNMMNKTRKYLIKNHNKNIQKLSKLFLRGLFNGDGTFVSSIDKYGSTHSYLRFFERDKPFIEDYKKLLNNLKLNGKIKKIKNKNLYILTINLNWNKLLKLFELGLIEDKDKQYQKLIKTIKNHKTYRSQKYFKNLNPIFYGNQIRELMPKEICYNWVRKRINEGTIQRQDRGIYKLTENGLYTKEILENIN